MAAIKRIFKNREWLIIIALSIIVLLLRLPSLEHPFDNDSAANAYHARLIVRGEPLYGSHHPAHHLPAVYYTYALAFLLFGDSMWAVKFLLLLWIIATVYLLYRLGALLMTRTIGFLAAVFYAVLTAHLWMWGNSAEIEQFANLPRIAAFLVLIHLVRRYPVKVQSGGTWQFMGVGLLGAVAFLFKAVYLSPLFLAGFVLLLDLWPDRTNRKIWLSTIKRGLWVGLGFGIGLVAVGLYFGFLGLLPRLLRVFQLGQGYVNNSIEGPQYAVLHPLTGLAYNNVVMLVFSLVGLLTILFNKKHRTVTLLSVAAWYLLSFLEAGLVVRVFRFYYYLLIVPPLSLLAAWFSLQFYHQVSGQLRRSQRFIGPLLFTILLAAMVTPSIVQNFKFYYHYVKYRLGQETHREFLIEGSPFGPQLVLLQEVADYVQAHTESTDRIYYWSENVQVYYLADRLAPVETVWLHYTPLLVGSHQKIFTPQTKYFILDPDRAGWEWAQDELARNYQLETVIYEQQLYRRIEETEGQ